MSKVTGLEMTQKGFEVSSQIGILLRGEQPKKGDILVSDVNQLHVDPERVLIEPTVQDMVLMRTPHAVSTFGSRAAVDAVISKLEDARDRAWPKMQFDLEEDFEVWLADHPTCTEGEAEKYILSLVRRHPRSAAFALKNLLRP